MRRVAMWTATLLFAGFVTEGVVPASAQTTTFNTFDKKSNRKEYGVIDNKTGRFDTYDKKSQHTGYGFIDRGRTTAPRTVESGTVQGRKGTARIDKWR
jgi:hypothetical protein